jgi:hypothetical protein
LEEGVNKSALLVVEIDRLKITGKQDPVDDEVDLVVSNLKPKQVNYALIRRVVHDKESLNQMLEKFDQSGFEPSAQSESYLQVRAKITAGGEFVLETSAPLLCDTGRLKDEGVDVHNLSSPSVKVAEAVNNVLDNVEKFCSPQKNVVQTSSFDVKSGKDTNGFKVHVADQTKKLEYVIVIPDNSNDSVNNDFSVHLIQASSTHT